MWSIFLFGSRNVNVLHYASYSTPQDRHYGGYPCWRMPCCSRKTFLCGLFRKWSYGCARHIAYMICNMQYTIHIGSGIGYILLICNQEKATQATAKIFRKSAMNNYQQLPRMITSWLLSFAMYSWTITSWVLTFIYVYGLDTYSYRNMHPASVNKPDQTHGAGAIIILWQIGVVYDIVSAVGNTISFEQCF